MRFCMAPAHDRHPGRLSAAALALAVVALPALVQSPRAEAQNESRERQQLGITELEADVIEYDLETRQYELTGDVKVTTPDSRLTAERMTVQRTRNNQLEWAKGEEKVYIEKKDREAGTEMT